MLSAKLQLGLFGGVVRWFKGQVLPEMAGLELHHLYRALNSLAANKEMIEAHLLVVLTQKLSADVSLSERSLKKSFSQGAVPHSSRTRRSVLARDCISFW